MFQWRRFRQMCRNFMAARSFNLTGHFTVKKCLDLCFKQVHFKCWYVGHILTVKVIHILKVYGYMHIGIAMGPNQPLNNLFGLVPLGIIGEL